MRVTVDTVLYYCPRMGKIGWSLGKLFSSYWHNITIFNFPTAGIFDKTVVSYIVESNYGHTN